MTIKGIREFIKKFPRLLRRQGILRDGHYYTKHNVIDICGFLHSKITFQLKFSHNPGRILTAVKNFIDEIFSELKDDQMLYMIFDPIAWLKADDQNEFSQLKLKEIQRRIKATAPINEFTGKDISEIKRHMYHYIKEDYGDRKNVKFILSQIEADMMVGSYIKKLQKENPKLKPSEITIISTDCDMLVIGWPYEVQNQEYIIDSKKFFELFGFFGREDICGIPECQGCDYNEGSQALYFLAKTKTKYEGCIYKVFMNPELAEPVYDIEVENKNWYKELKNLFIRVKGDSRETSSIHMDQFESSSKKKQKEQKKKLESSGEDISSD